MHRYIVVDKKGGFSNVMETVKAILVMDKMPENCYDCDLCGECCYCNAVGERSIDFETCDKQRMDWCPLIEAPKKFERDVKEITIVDSSSYECGFQDGWDYCIKSLGEKKNGKG